MFKENKMDELFEAYLAVYEANKAEVHLNMSDEDKQKRRNIRWADNAHGIDNDNTIMIRDKDTANLVNKMRVSRHRKNPSLDKERTRGTVTNKYLHRQQDKKELQNKLQKAFSMSENVEYILDILVSEGYVDNYDLAACILEAMSDEWLVGILDEKQVNTLNPKGRDHRTQGDRKRRKPVPEKYKFWEGEFEPNLRSPSSRRRKEERNQARGGFKEDYITEAPYQIYGPDPHGPSDSESRPIGKPYKNKKRAKNRADRLDQEIGGYRHTVHYVEDDK
jgi:hypothetical protein